jgi:hypothetical protein
MRRLVKTYAWLEAHKLMLWAFALYLLLTLAVLELVPVPRWLVLPR